MIFGNMERNGMESELTITSSNNDGFVHGEEGVYSLGGDQSAFLHCQPLQPGATPPQLHQPSIRYAAALLDAHFLQRPALGRDASHLRVPQRLAPPHGQPLQLPAFSGHDSEASRRRSDLDQAQLLQVGAVIADGAEGLVPAHAPRLSPVDVQVAEELTAVGDGGHAGVRAF